MVCLGTPFVNTLTQIYNSKTLPQKQPKVIKITVQSAINYTASFFPKWSVQPV